MRRPPLTPSVVRGLFTISGHADCLAGDYSYEGRDGLHELDKGAEYLKELLRWYRSNHPDFDVVYETPEEPTDSDDYKSRIGKRSANE